MDLQRRDLREPDERGEVVDQRVLVGVVGVLDRAALAPRSGAGVVEVLLEEHLAGLVRRADAVHPALARRRAVRWRAGSATGAMRGVVGEHLGLGRAGLGVEHLVEVREREAVRPRRVTICFCAMRPSMPALGAQPGTRGVANWGVLGS